MNTNLAPNDAMILDCSFTNIHRAGNVIPILLELIRFIEGWCSKEEGEHPTQLWCNGLFTHHTQGEMETAVELLARLVDLEVRRAADRLDVGDF